MTLSVFALCTLFQEGQSVHTECVCVCLIRPALAKQCGPKSFLLFQRYVIALLACRVYGWSELLPQSTSYLKR